MGKLSSERTYQRIAFVYLCFIIAATAMFFFLGLTSFRLQRSDFRTLSERNVTLWTQRLAAEFERHVWEAAETSLRDPELETLSAFEGPLTPPDARSVRSVLARVSARHPIARAFILLEGTQVRFPLLDNPGPRPQPRARTPSDLKAEAILVDARRLLSSRRPDRAAPLFLQARAAARADWLKAEAESGFAAVQMEMGARDVAVEAYERLILDYGEIVDEQYMPFALRGALALARMLPSGQVSPARSLGVLKELRQGRWELSLTDLNRAVDGLSALLPGELVRQALELETDFTVQLRVASQVVEELGATSPRRIRQLGLSADPKGNPQQIFFQALDATRVVAFVADLEWMAREQLPACQAEYPSDLQLDVQLRQQQGGGSDISTVPLRGVLDSWELYVSPEEFAQKQEDLRETASGLVLSSLMFLSVLGLALYLLLRLTREVQLSQVQSTFFSAFSHELKTPLTLIRLYTEILIDDEGTRRDRESYYRIISRASINLTKLIDGFQSFVLVRRKRMRFNLKPGDLNSAIAETVLGYGEYLRRQEFEFDVDLAQEPLIVNLDGEAVSQAVLNLLENARKYSVDDKYIGLRLWRDGDSAILEVEDRGSGIKPEDHGKIFEEFYRVESLERERSGFGLGLFLVRHIMVAHQGVVELNSTLGEGSCFRLIFPLAPSGSTIPESETVLVQRGVSH